MSQRLSRAERRRQERQRKQIRNIIIISGVALLVAAFFLWTSNRPLEDLNIPEARNSPVPMNGLTIGSPEAPVLVEAFEDFQCPSCLRFTEDIEPIIVQNYVNTGIARFQYRNFAFIGAESLAASQAAMCANDQGGFWAFHDTLYANQLGENIGAFSNRRLSAMAEQLGLDVDKWESCYNADTYQSFVLDEALNPFNVVHPGQRPRSTLTPSIALKDGKPLLAFSVQGGDTQDQNLLQFFLNVVEFGMNVQQAAEAHNITSFQMQSSFGAHKAEPGRLQLTKKVPEWVRGELGRMGYDVETVDRTYSPITAIYFDRKHATMWGGASDYGEDYGVAW